VVCHHSGWTGSRSKAKRGEIPEIPMLQRVRDALHDIDSRKLEDGDADGDGDDEKVKVKVKVPMRKVNLVHRLDRGASGALLLTYADADADADAETETDVDTAMDQDDSEVAPSTSKSRSKTKTKGATAQLIDAMASDESIKTYIALVRGEGILRGEDLKEKGWFEVNRPMKGESGSGEEKEAITQFHFVAGQPEYTDEDGVERPRISMVLARPKQGRWHQIRRHLNGLSHPILGDTSHGASKVNREWKEQRNMPGERLCLHMGRMQLQPSEAVPEGIDVACPMLDDMLDMLRVHAPQVLEDARPMLEKEGLLVERKDDDDHDCEYEYEVGEYKIPDALLFQSAAAGDDGTVEILEKGEHYVVAAKLPSIVCHHSSWTGKRSDPKRRWNEPVPMLQRVRDATGQRVNLIHRLDRGASGCLLLSFAQTNSDSNDNDNGASASASARADEACAVTRSLIASMQNPDATKTYLALCDGDGTWNGKDFRGMGWFSLEIPVKDEWGKEMINVKTDIKFVASTILPATSTNNASTNNVSANKAHDKIDTTMNANIENEGINTEVRKISIILARPSTGKWHQVRQHLASGTIGHAILGDSSHGRSRTNRMWKTKGRMKKERTCLHLARIQLPPSEYAPNGIDVSCPLANDLEGMLKAMPTSFVEETRQLLLEDNVRI